MKKLEIKNSYYFLITLIFLGTIGYFLYSAVTVSDSGSTTKKPLTNLEADKIEKLNKSLDKNIFENNFFRDAKIFGEYPIKPGLVGKSQPFTLPVAPTDQIIDNIIPAKTKK